jgi:hypothetical protein
MHLRAVLTLLGIAALCSAGRLPVSVYRTAEGLPRNSVGCMVAGQNGVMWFCTTEGLVRFDGHEFRVFGPEHGLPSRTVYAFFAARTGGYWIITDRGLCRLPASARIGDPCRIFTPTPAEGSASWPSRRPGMYGPLRNRASFVSVRRARRLKTSTFRWNPTFMCKGSPLARLERCWWDPNGACSNGVPGVKCAT